jgi:putative hemolysin
MGDGSTGPGGGTAPTSGRDDHTGLKTPRLRRTLARVLVRGADAATRWVARLLGENPRADLTEAELRDLVARSLVLDGDERRLIDDVIVAGDRHVRELMVPRTEVVFLEAAASVVDAARLVGAARHSRFPVVDGTHDDVIGFVHLRDLLIRPDVDTASTVGELARPLCRLPASKRVLAALSEMRREGDHVALVVDEYGGTAGIVTLEDLIEELVGEIHDEYDAAPEPTAADGAIPSEVEGLLNLNDFAERVGVTLPSGPYDTVGGFVMASLGRLPTLGDETFVHKGGDVWRLRVVEMDGRRVARVGLSLVPPAVSSPPEASPPAEPSSPPEASPPAEPSSPPEASPPAEPSSAVEPPDVSRAPDPSAAGEPALTRTHSIPVDDRATESV